MNARSQSTLLYTSPPPTVNNLDSEQRARLMKSTRKLGAMLGATPQLVEVGERPNPIPISFRPTGLSKPATLKTKSHRRHGSIFDAFPEISPYSSSSSASSSQVSLPPVAEHRSSVDTLPIPKSFSTNPRRSGDAPRPLVLRLNTPVSSSNPVSPDSAKTIKFSELKGGMRTPTPATPITPTPSEVRRKRMAKLTRTLGENVPPELVFSQQAPLGSYTGEHSICKPRTMSVDHAARRDVFARTSQIWMTGTKGWQGAWNRKDIREVQKQLRNLKAR
ncbi:hypothetical protein QCA50_007404 [Cerrena zonata]|uniref:Uncharacterized protein n=1 Tax=Cerrena zonata TaxID=2478898 RepID=A0AAW0GJF7_9APHY